MLMAVDIGNTNIVIGFLEGERIVGSYRITTKALHTSDEYTVMISQFLQISGYTRRDVEDVIVCSVVPKVMHSFRASIIKFLGFEPMVVGPGIKTGINIHMDDPKTMGADCLTDCVGAYYTYCLLYTSPSPRDAHESRMPSYACRSRTRYRPVSYTHLTLPTT